MTTKLGFIFTAVALGAMGSTTRAAIVLSDDFNGYNAGNLVGQGGWTQNGTSAVTPVQVTNAAAIDRDVTLGTSGQDVQKAFNAPVPHTDGNAIYSGLTINLTAAQTAGDYFFHLADSVGSSNFYERLHAKAVPGGYVLGNYGTSTASPVYGTQVLSFNTEYRVAIAWNFVTGALNDTFAIYVNPTDSVEANNTPYVTTGWLGTNAEPSTAIGVANLRQGGASNAPSVIVDSLTIATDFASVVPEPTSLAALGLAGLLVRRRR